MTLNISAISKATAEHYVWGKGCDGWHLVKDPQLSVIQERMPAGTTEVRHFHHHAQQFFYILAGTAVMDVESGSIALTAGEGVWIPAGAPHQMKNESGDEVHFLVISQPPSHGDREIRREVAHARANGQNPTVSTSVSLWPFESAAIH
jgi:mannose-6-phosphate isomerase-like protein (cupin superfamily)